MKRFLSLFLVVAMLASFLVMPAHASETYTVKADKVTAAAGDEVEINVILENSPGVIAGEVTIEFDPAALQVKTNGKTGKQEKPIYSSKLTNTSVAVNFDNAEGNFKITFAASEATEEDGNNLFSVTFVVADDAKVGEHELKVTASAFATGAYDANDEYVTHKFNVAVENGSVTVECKSHTDVNPKDHLCDNCATEMSKCANTIKKVDGKAADCTEDGWNAYYECETCGKLYADEKCANEIKDLDAWKKGDGKIAAGHKYVEVAAQAEVHTQTELKAAVDAHVQCSVCKKLFGLDGKEYTLEELTGETPEHSFGELKSDENKHWKECSCGLKSEEANHTDVTVKDHKCDVCNEVVSECADGDKNHKCDTCNEAMGTCEDKDKNHKCDYGCTETYGEHGDTDKDHACDYGCKEAIGTHGDTDKDHVCDYGCKEAIGTHGDTDKDHACDYGCKEAIGTHGDTDKDHACDYGCEETIGEHKDATDDKDHDCDYCGVTMDEAHADADENNVCDICGGNLACNHKDENKDHKCDTCKETISQCADTNKDHKCDTCGKTVSECADTNKDHKCDTCGKTVSECADANKDHKCDTCGETLTSCKDDNNDGKCDTCGAEVEIAGKIYRVAGDNRIETALAVAAELKDVLGVDSFDSIIIAAAGSGDDQTKFADALSGSYLATVKNAPILLYTKDALSSKNLAFIEENLSANGTIYLLGGNVSIPEEVENSLKTAGYNTKRLGGANRYETNLVILGEAGTGNKEILIAGGQAFADSLSASATGLPVLLVNGEGTELTEKQIEFLQGVKGNKITILGGTAAVSAELEEAIEEVVGKNVGRLAGACREETSVMVAEEYYADAEFALITYSKMYPDGLAGGVLAFAKKAPLLLVRDNYDSYAIEFIEENGIESGYVLGGTAVVSDGLAKDVFGLSGNAVIIVK